MKKNKMMRLASLLLVLTLMSTCAISGTFAKYVTSETGTDSARVAKFGVTITANGSMFANSYAKSDSAFTEANSVISTEDVVAPGTSGKMSEMTLTGTPEVAVRVNYEATTVSFTNWAVTGDTWYCPIFVTINSTPLSGLDYDSAADFEAAIKAAIASYSKDYPAGTNLADKNSESLSISWKWDFSGATGIKDSQTDAKDTELGNNAAGGTVIGIEIAVKTTVTQID